LVGLKQEIMREVEAVLVLVAGGEELGALGCAIGGSVRGKSGGGAEKDLLNRGG
jgi:hypothetical protein